MIKRLITGIVYFAIWFLLFALKWVIPVKVLGFGAGGFAFDAFFCAAAVLGSLELLRAIGVSSAQKIITVAFCAAAVPLYAAVEVCMGQGFIALAILAAIYLAALLILSLVNKTYNTYIGFGKSVFAMAYCGVLFALMSAVNHLDNNSDAALLLMFVCISCTDSVALFTGMGLGRFLPWKLAPRVSPNKTIVGAVGGLLGGMVGGVIAYYIHKLFGGLAGTPLVYAGGLHPAVIFMLFGLALAVVGQLGDLAESAIKRKCGIKDMGRLLPGHGGVLDRFDSLLFGGFLTFVLFIVFLR